MAYETIICNGKERQRFIPEGAMKVKEKSGLGVAYVYQNGHSIRIMVLAYAGNRAEPTFHNSYRFESQARKAVESFFAGLRAHKAAVEERRAKANGGHTLQVGDIITNSWGYDQTNVDWYRVVRVSRTFVWLEGIAAEMTRAIAPMAGYEMATIDVTGEDPASWGPKGTGKVTKHKAEGETVTMRFGCGSKWDGREMYSSSYA